MYRVSKMSGTYLALQIDSVIGDAENIQTLAMEGEPVIIVNDLDELEFIGINPEEVEIVV